MVFSNGYMIAVGIELNAMNRSFFLEPFNNFIGPLINNIDPSLLTPRNNIIGLTGDSIDIISMNMVNLMGKLSNP